MKTSNFLFFFLISCALSTAASSLSDQIGSQNTKIKASVVVNQLQYPWAVQPLPENEFLISQKSGSLLHIVNNKKHLITGMPVPARVGQGGLLDIAISPNFTQDSMLYFTFSESDSKNQKYGTSVGRGKLALNKRIIENVQIIYRALPKSSGGIHFGSRLQFDRKGYLYISLGERGSMQRAQNIQDPYGSLLRLNPDGSIPADNPFAGKQNAAREIWSYGHRNAQGMTLHPETGAIWLHEHGPKGGDELNIIKKGANYGWPRTTHGINYNGTIISDLKHAAGIEDSATYWVPSIAPSGMTFYQGGIFPAWQGNIFLGALVGKHLRRIVIENNMVISQEILFKNKLGRIRDVRTGNDGFIYVLTDARSATLYRIELDK